MNLGELSVNFVMLCTMCIMLSAAFGWLMNWIAGWLEKEFGGGESPFTSALVVVGVAGTVVISMPIIGVVDALLVLAMFAASGLPMVVGHVRRYVAARRAAAQALRDAIGGAE